MTSSQPELAALSSVAALVGEVDSTVIRLVAQARDRGATWEDIGQALGITRQAAHYRYSRILGAGEPESLEAEDAPTS